jgi:hypothetical protein
MGNSSSVSLNNIKTTFTPTGNFDADKDRAETYAKAIKMDQANAKMAVVMATEGKDAAAKAMIKEHTNSDCKFDYAAMRGMYG